MTVTEIEKPAMSAPARARKAGRVGVTLMLVVAIAATAVTRQWAMHRRDVVSNVGKIGGVTGVSSTSSLSAMPSFATALLLGGLRGPLVMILWTTSETQKQQHDLQDFDTKVEWIRLLQPEFDTVHLFQIWNKAYNISVQMSSLNNKYTTILDALEYGRRVDQERPDDLNIINAVAAIYGDKLGTSQEHPYYRKRVRRETQTLVRVTFPTSRLADFRAQAAPFGWDEQDAPVITDDQTHTASVLLEKPLADALQKSFTGPGVQIVAETPRDLSSNDPSWRRIRLDPLVDINGYLLPDLVRPVYPRPADLAADQPWYDGSQMQFLKQYEPFPYGVSPLAISYNDYKRSQLLLRLWGQHHIQSGDVVIDSRPALALKLWAEGEWERGRRYEMSMWPVVPPVPDGADPMELEVPTANFLPSRPLANPLALPAAIYSYNLSARLFRDARAEYEDHMRRYITFAQTYAVHVDDSLSGEQLMLADRDYLELIHAPASERQRLIDSAAEEYQKAETHFAYTVLKYYVDDTIAAKVFPRDPKTHVQYTRANIEQMDPALYLPTFRAVQKANELFFVDASGHYLPSHDQYHDDRDTYVRRINRCTDRLAILHTLASTTKP